MFVYSVFPKCSYIYIQLIQAGKGEALRIRAILRSLVPIEDLVGVISLPVQLPSYGKGLALIYNHACAHCEHGKYMFCHLPEPVVSFVKPQMVRSLSQRCQPVLSQTTRPPWCCSSTEFMVLKTRTSCFMCWRLASCLTWELQPP